MASLKKTFLIIFVAFAAYMVKGFIDVGLLRTIEPQSSFTSCSNLVTNQGKNIPLDKWKGCEDAEIDHKSGLMFISCADHVHSHAPRWNSSILMFDSKQNTVSELKIEFMSAEHEATFFTHGISVLRTGDDIDIYSVNHGKHDSVNVFRYVGAEKKLIQTHNIEHSRMRSMNDVVAVPGGVFYASNDLALSHGHPLGLAEGLLRIPDTTGIGCDISTGVCEDVAPGIRSGNGIAFIPGSAAHPKARILLSGAGDLAIHVYSRVENSLALKYEYSIPLGSAGDNIVIAEDGTVWIAAHPKVLTFFAAAGDFSLQMLSPSQVLTITFADHPRYSSKGKPTYPNSVVLDVDSRYILEQVYINNGEEASGSSTAVPFGKQVAITTVFMPTLLICDLP